MDKSGYRLVRSDHPNDKRRGISIYFKSSFLIQTLGISMLHECINLEITTDGKLSQNKEEFETFVKNLKLNLEFIFNKNPYLTVVNGD